MNLTESREPITSGSTGQRQRSQRDLKVGRELVELGFFVDCPEHGRGYGARNTCKSLGAKG